MPVTIEDIYLQKYEIETHSFTPKEAYDRLKISRGYYATFLYARELFNKNAIHKLNLYNKCLAENNYGSHERVYESLIRSEISNLMYIGKALKKYHRLRKDSDYKLYMHIREYELMLAEQHFRECKERIDFFITNGEKSFLSKK